MSEDGSNRPRRVRRVAVAMARAVALFILVTGIYGALTIALPRWPLLNRSAAAILAGVFIFELLRPSRRTAVPVAADPLPIADSSEELDEAQRMIDALRSELDQARERESEVRQQYERESEHLQRAASRAVDEIQRIRAAHDEARGMLEMERGRATASQQEIEALRAERQRIGRELEVARQKMEVDRTRLADLQKEVDLTHATSQKVVQANEALKKQIEQERQRLQAEVQRVAAESKREREEMQAEARAVATRLDELLAQLDRERKLSQELGATRARLAEENASLKKARDAAAAEVTRLQQRIEELTRDHEAQRNNTAGQHEAERQRLVQEHESAREQLEAEWNAKLENAAAELSANREAARAEGQTLRQQIAELQKASDESALREVAARGEAGALRQQIADLQRTGEESAQRDVTARAAADALRQQIASVQQELEAVRSERVRALQSLDEQWSAKLQKIVNGLTADHETDMGDAISQREEARAEVRALHLKISRLEDDNETLKQQLESVVVPAVDEAALREAIDGEWSAKLQKIVNGLTADHENDIGEAIAQREEARAEVRALHQKISKLESAAATPAVDEAALRGALDAEWSAKLQTIVSHIASDHEADVGRAIEEREAARAELRNVNIKMTALQQKLDGERQAHEALQARYRELEEKMRNAPTQPMHALRETEIGSREPEEVFTPATTADSRPPAPNAEQRARADVLQFAEQAFEALKRATSPGSVPVPAVDEKKPCILIVHHDPRFRAMWQEFLEKNGFAVQTAADGLEGLRIVKSEKPDAVIADVAMPKMDGRELCQMIKSNPDTAEVKVILLSGMYTSELPQPGDKAEFEPDELLRKPVKLDAMKAALSNVLAARLAS